SKLLLQFDSGFSRMCERDKSCRKLRCRRRTATDGGFAGFEREIQFGWRDLFNGPLCPLLNLTRCQRQHLKRGYLVRRVVSRVRRQRCLERGEPEFVTAQGAIQ